MSRTGGARLAGIAKTSQFPERPLITVATVVYNGAAVIETAIRSVLSQSYDNVEYLVIDGASTDGTLDIVRRHEADIDYWISEPDKGIYDAMNKALHAARGDWILFLGADDELLVPLETLVGRMTDRSAVYYGNVEVTSSGAVTGGRFSRYTLMQRNICHQSVFYPRAVYQAKDYDCRAGMLADYKYNIELWGAGVPFIHLDRVISRFNDEGVSSGDQSYFDEIKLAAIRDSFGPSFHAMKRLRNLAVRAMTGFRSPAPPRRT